MAENIEKEASSKLNSIMIYFKRNKRIVSRLYRKASKLYKQENNFAKSLECIVNSAEINELLEDFFEASIDYLEAAKMSKIVSDDNIVIYYKKHIEYNNNTNIGQIYKDIADYFKSQGKYDNAILWYKDAIEILGLDSHYSTIYCLKNLSIIYINLRDYKLASETTYTLAKSLKTIQNKYILAGLMCAINYDTIKAKQDLNLYKDYLKKEEIEFIEKCIDLKNVDDLEELKVHIEKYNLKFKVKKEHLIIVEDLINRSKYDSGIFVLDEDLT